MTWKLTEHFKKLENSIKQIFPRNKNAHEASRKNNLTILKFKCSNQIIMRKETYNLCLGKFTLSDPKRKN
jgi:hypothetical protein